MEDDYGSSEDGEENLSDLTGKNWRFGRKHFAKIKHAKYILKLKTFF